MYQNGPRIDGDGPDGELDGARRQTGVLVVQTLPLDEARLLSSTHRCTQSTRRRWAFPVQGAAIISSAYGPRQDPFIADWYQLTPSTNALS